MDGLSILKIPLRCEFSMKKFVSEFRKKYRDEGLSESVIRDFQEIILNFYQEHERDFPWRQTRDPYRIFVSEMMLQQTSTASVMNKYQLFIKKWPTFQALAEASQQEVVAMWQGLGYNRRAIWTKTIAEQVVDDFGGNLPQDEKELRKFKGIGEATSGEICAFAFNKPVVIVNEVNIKRVYIYFFFRNAEAGLVKNKDLKPIIEKTNYVKEPRVWYYALMDYGVMLKTKFPKIHKKSSSYKKQSKFEGSNRQLRGKILRYMIKHKKATVEEVALSVRSKIAPVKKNLVKMTQEGFLKKSGSHYKIAQ